MKSGLKELSRGIIAHFMPICQAMANCQKPLFCYTKCCINQKALKLV